MSRVNKFRCVLLVIFTSLLTISAYAQQEESEVPTAESEQTTKTRTELLNELSLRTAQVVLENARETHDRYESVYKDALRLFGKSIISQKELDDALSAYTQAQQLLEQAKIELERTKLSFLANATHITIMEAKKYYDNQGRRKLDLVLRNTSNLALAESALGLTESGSESRLKSDWQSPEQIRALLNIENIIVSIVNDTSSSIGKPYEQIIPVLSYDKQKELTFTLLTDV